MTTIQQLPQRRRPPQQSLFLVKVGTLIGFICLLIQIIILKIRKTSSNNDASSSSSSFSSSSSRLLQPLQQIPPLPPPTTTTDPVLLVGLPYSGSLALHEYFTCHRKPSVHYCCDGSDRTAFPCENSQKTCGECILKKMQSQQHQQQQQSPLESCQPSAQVWSQYDVETADQWFLPQHFALGLLHQAYPNATWILNRRNNARQWAKSVLHWHSMTRRFFHSYGFDMYPQNTMIQTPPDPSTKVSAEEIEIDMAKALNERVYNRTEYLRKWTLLERIYDNHTATIRAWARQFPSHRLIEIDVDNDVSITILDEAFGYFSPGKCDWSFEPPDDDWKDFSLPF